MWKTYRIECRIIGLHSSTPWLNCSPPRAVSVTQFYIELHFGLMDFILYHWTSKSSCESGWKDFVYRHQWNEHWTSYNRNAVQPCLTGNILQWLSNWVIVLGVKISINFQKSFNVFTRWQFGPIRIFQLKNHPRPPPATPGGAQHVAHLGTEVTTKDTTAVMTPLLISEPWAIALHRPYNPEPIVYSGASCSKVSIWAASSLLIYSQHFFEFRCCWTRGIMRNSTIHLCTLNLVTNRKCVLLSS